MGETTGIEWTQATWNPWVGCHKVSPACAHCYMFREQKMYGKNPNVVLRTKPATFDAPLKWKQGRLIFTCSWSDFFIEEADPWRLDAYRIMRDTSHHTYQVLTKRPERIRKDYPWIWTVPENIWMGVSVENARYYSRIDKLELVPAAIRFLSIEPSLGRMQNLPLDGIGWVIVGGESGPGFRPFNETWAREIRDQCVAKNIPFFLKQKSGLWPKKIERTLDGKLWEQMPK